jgi:hypothetical membrane protein
MAAAQRGLLWCGVSGAAMFVVTFLVNDALRPDYEPVRDTVSEAAIGRDGGVQIANFVVAGVLITASSFAVSRAVNARTGRLLRVFGVCLALAGVFVSDPVPHDRATWHGTAHIIVSVVVFVSLAGACFAAARWRPDWRWRWYCIVSGVAVPVLFVIAGGASGATGLGQRVTIVVGWTWVAVLAAVALRRDQPPRVRRR